MKRVLMGIMVVLCAGASMATVIFQDNFENNSGDLNNRRPDAYDSSVSTLAYWKNAGLNLVVTNGVLQTISASAQQSAWLALPEILSGDVIRCSAVVVANGDATTDWLAIGLTQSRNHLYQTGEPYVTLTRRPTGVTGADQGFLNVYGGLGSSNLIDSNSWLKEANGFTTNLNARNVVTFEYDTASGNLEVWLTSEQGTLVEHYNGAVNYGGVAGAVVPVEELIYFGVTFNALNDSSNANPAYIDNLVVEVISAVPEPATLSLFAISGTGLFLLRRARR